MEAFGQKSVELLLLMSRSGLWHCIGWRSGSGPLALVAASSQFRLCDPGLVQSCRGWWWRAPIGRRGDVRCRALVMVMLVMMMLTGGIGRY